MAALAGPFLVTTALLGAGGALKVVRPAPTAGALRQMGLPASPGLVRVGAAAELAIATAAIVDGSRPFSALVAISYVAFAAFVAAALRRNVPLSSCGCFGTEDTPPTAVHLALNVAGAAVAGAVALGVAAGGGLAEIARIEGTLLPTTFVASTVAAGWLAYVALTRLPRVLAGASR